MDLGFEREGFEIDFVNEYSDKFLEGYKYSRKKMGMDTPKNGYYCGDINELLTGNNKRKIKDYIEKSKKKGYVGFIGGPPCPDFSVAGKNQGITGENGRLTVSYKKAILIYEPDFFVFENVKGLWSTKKHKEEYNKLKGSLTRKGYVLVDKLVNALEYGVPQDRERIILFGIKYQLINDDRKTAKKILQNKFKWNDNIKYPIDFVKNIIWPEMQDFEMDSDRAMPQEIIEELTVEYWFRKNDVYNHPNANSYFTPHSVERFCNIKEGDVSRKSFKRLHRWRYSPTAAYGNNEVHLHPYKARRLSVAEALAIQSLPKEFELPNNLSKSEMFKTIGNGVPYLLSQSIAHSVKDFLDNIED